MLSWLPHCLLETLKPFLVSLSPPRQTGQNVYSLHAEQPPSPLSRCAFRLRLSGHFLLLVTKKKLYILYM